MMGFARHCYILHTMRLVTSLRRRQLGLVLIMRLKHFQITLMIV